MSPKNSAIKLQILSIDQKEKIIEQAQGILVLMTWVCPHLGPHLQGLWPGKMRCMCVSSEGSGKTVNAQAGLRLQSLPVGEVSKPHHRSR